MTDFKIDGLTAHVCAHCFGRLLKGTINGETAYLCSNCERTHIGEHVEELCACGLLIAGRQTHRCVANPNPSDPWFPGRYVAKLR